MSTITVRRPYRIDGDARISRVGSPTERIGDWRLVRRLPPGQWSEVYQARPYGLGEDGPADYVLKTLRAELRGDRVAIAAIQREAHIGRRVSHPHVAPVLSADVDQPPFYLVMPHIRGRRLEELLEERTRLVVPRALWIARQVAEGLSHLHRSGWIHADVTPSNILVSRVGHATLIDYGLARRAHGEDGRGPRPMVGTLTHMSPEMMLPTLPLTAACDVYGLGVTLFRMLTGAYPFPFEDCGRLASAHLRLPVESARVKVAQLPTGVARLTGRMLSKEPARRPTMDELIGELVALEIETLDQCLPDQCLPDQCLPDRRVPEQRVPDVVLEKL